MLFCHALVAYMYKNDPTERTTRCTFAVRQDENQTYSYATAWASPSDNFAKRIGRQIAHARLINNSPVHVNKVTTGAENYRDILKTVMADAMDKGPSRWTVTDITFFKTTSDAILAQTQ